MPALPGSAAAVPRKPGVLRRRAVSFVVLWSVMLAVMLPGGEAVADLILLVLLLIVALAGQAEFHTLWEKRGWACWKAGGMTAGALLIAGGFFLLTGGHDSRQGFATHGEFETGLLALLVLVSGTRCLFLASGNSAIHTLSLTLLGVLYVPWLLNFMQKIYFLQGIHPHGRAWLLYLMAVTKLGDTGGYVAGSLAGRHKIAPHISPGKTWEGLCGAFLTAVATSMIIAHFANDELAHMRSLEAALLGLVLGLAAVAGDLVESAFKREAGVKDSGALLPGIGGVLDLIDSLLFTAPVLYLYLCWFPALTPRA